MWPTSAVVIFVALWCSPVCASKLRSAVQRRVLTVDDSRGPEKILEVLDILQDINKTIHSEMEAAATLSKEAQKVCENTTATLTSEIEKADEVLENEKTRIAQLEAENKVAEQALEDAKTKLEETQAAQQTADALNAETAEDMEKQIAENAKQIEQLTQALKILRERFAFLQHEADAGQKVTGDPTSTNYIIGVIATLLANMNETQNQMLVDQNISTATAQATAGNSSAQASTLEAEEQSKTAQIQKGTVALTQTQLEFEANQEQKTSLAAQLDSTKANCESEKKSSEIVKEDQLNELSVLAEAMNYLKEAHKVASRQAVPPPAPPSFLQKNEDTEPESGGDGRMSLLTQALSSSTNQMGHEQIIALVQKLIKENLEEQVQEDEKHKKCKVDIAATQNELDTAKASRDRETSNQQQLRATLEVQMDNQKAMEENLEENDNMMQEQTALKEAQEAAFENSSKDNLLEVQILQKALAVLQKFYTEEGRGSAVIRLIEDMISNVGGTNKDLHTIHSETEAHYTAAKEKFREERDATQGKFDETVQSIASMKVRAANAAADIENFEKEVSAIDTRLAALHSDCDELIEKYSEWKEKRAGELGQLRSVVDLLSGSTGVAQPALVQGNLRRPS